MFGRQNNQSGFEETILLNPYHQFFLPGQLLEQPRCFFYQSVRGGFAYFETAFAEKLDNPFHRHGVDITQL